MVEETVGFLKDQRNLLSDLKFFLMDKRSPLRRMSVVSNVVIVLLAFSFIWYQQYTIGNLRDIVEKQNEAIAKLTSATIIQEEVSKKQLSLAEEGGESIGGILTDSIDTDNQIALLQDAYAAKIQEANKIKDELEKRNVVASAEFDLVKKTADIAIGDNVNRVDDVGKVTVVTKVVKLEPKPIPINAKSPPVVSKHPTTAVKRIVRTKKVQQIVDPLAGKTFKNTKDFRLYWEAELWNLLGKV